MAPAKPAKTPSRRASPQSYRPSFLRDILLLRLINAFSIATFFQPDEFFQSLEPAWRIAFGSESGAWLTWEWQHQLRSSLHPVLFSVFYSAAGAISTFIPPGNPVRAALVLGAPKLPQAIIAALGDWYTWQLAVKIYGSASPASYAALFLQLASPWQWYVSTRTFSNSLETTLTIAALYYWPWQLLADVKPTKGNPKALNVLADVWDLRLSLFLAAVAVVLRPTNALIWLTIVAVTFSRFALQGASPLSRSVAQTLIGEAILTGSLVLGLSFVSDRLYFGFWTFPPYQWLNFNITQSLAVFYGRNPWHYYLLQGLPLLCTTSLPFAVRALFKPAATSVDQSNILKALSYTVITTVLALSFISHKEVRFIYPLLPTLSVLAAPLAASFFVAREQPPALKAQSKPTTHAVLRVRNKPYLFAAVAINMFLAGYLSYLHQPAPLTVLSFLRTQYERIHPSSAVLSATELSGPSSSDSDLFALFLMPCHSTPWRSHLVYPNLTAYALTCEPPLHTLPNTPERDLYRDEADRFYDDPVNFLSRELFVPDRSFPSPRYVVAFEGVEPWLRAFLDGTPEGRALGWDLRLVWSGFNGFFNEDWRRAGNMLVWETGVHGDLLVDGPEVHMHENW